MNYFLYDSVQYVLSVRVSLIPYTCHDHGSEEDGVKRSHIGKGSHVKNHALPYTSTCTANFLAVSEPGIARRKATYALSA